MNNYTTIESDTQHLDSTETNRNGGIDQSSPTTWTLAQRLKESSHPAALIFYMFFRLAPVFTYVFGGVFIGILVKQSKFILHFIILILLISADFWNLKNIAGRLLVGLRWWNETNIVDDSTDVENVWIFETADPSRYINPIDSKVFWTLLYVTPLVWIGFGVIALMKLEFLYLIFIGISITLSFTNALAFTKCDKFGKANNLASDILFKNTGSIFRRLNPFSN